MLVKLRAIRSSDLDLIREWRMLPDVTKYMYTEPIITKEMQKKWFDNIMSNKKSEKYWIIQLDEKIDVGLLSITEIDYINQKACWAYYLGSMEARGKGLARILECNIYDYVFNELKINKLWCEVFEFNENVIKIHEKFGSKIEGLLKDHIKKNGEFFNVVRMAILGNEWKETKESFKYEKLEIEKY